MADETTAATGVVVTQESTFARVEGDIKGFFTNLVSDIRKARQIWTLIASSQTRAFLIKVATDVLKFVQDAGGAIDAKGINFTLDSQVWTDAQQLIADAKAGDAIVTADLKILGITV